MYTRNKSNEEKLALVYTNNCADKYKEVKKNKKILKEKKSKEESFILITKAINIATNNTHNANNRQPIRVSFLDINNTL